jgi:hypothetical protein
MVRTHAFQKLRKCCYPQYRTRVWIEGKVVLEASYFRQGWRGEAQNLAFTGHNHQPTRVSGSG